MKNMENNVKVVRGDVFIIPNIADVFNSFISSIDWMKEKSKRLIGIEPMDEDMMVNVWITSDTVDNWQDNFAGFQREIGLINDEAEEVLWEEKKGREARLLGYFPKYIPARVFAGKKEGDEINFHCPEYDVDIILTCRQRNYRYASFGNFEDVYSYVLREG
jgi:hypothetical protein